MLHRALRLRRNHLPASPCRRAAFTLAELLIVIAIIGVLIAILLPSLAAARRSANAAKCLAAMRDIGLAFQQYAQDNKRAFPVVEYSPGAASLIPNSSPRRPWQDFLIKYLHKREPTTPDPALDKLRPNSVLWGCPSFEPDSWWQNVDPGTSSFNASAPNKFNTGYAMSRWVLAPYGTTGPPYTPQVNGTAASPGNLAIIRDGAAYGQFFKMEKWGVRAAERGLIADSNNYDLIGSATWSKSAQAGTGASDRRCDPFLPTITGQSYINVDGIRHLSPGAGVKKAVGSKGVNMLFVDGHASSVTPEEAWIATRGGGLDIRTP